VKFDLIIVRYGEIALKSKYVRKKFEKILITNIKTILNEEKIKNKIEKEWGRIYIFTDQISPALRVLKKIFGIVNFSPSVKTSSDLDSISNKAVNFSKKFLKKNMSFAVRTTRTGNHSYTSQDVSVRIGKDIIENIGCSVDLTNPDFELFIEIRKNNSYIFKEKITGSGGMPVSSQDKILCVVDNVYSILASWYLLRRGCQVLFFVKKDFDINLLKSFLEKWYIESDIFFYKENKNFYKKINEFVSEKNCKAVVTGFFNLKKDISKLEEFKREINVPILHPLISMNEKKLKDRLHDIGL